MVKAPFIYEIRQAYKYKRGRFHTGFESELHKAGWQRVFATLRGARYWHLNPELTLKGKGE